MECFKGVLHGVVARFSSRRREPKCKPLKEERPCKTLKEERVFSCITLKVSKEGSWEDVVKAISDFTEGVLSCTIEKNGTVNITGDFYSNQILKLLWRLMRKGEMKKGKLVGFGISSPSSKKVNPSTNNTNLIATQSQQMENVQGMPLTVVNMNA